MVWYRIKNKNDPEDILMDAKVDGERIYQPVAVKRRVIMKSAKANLIKKYLKLKLILNLVALKKDDYVRSLI